MVRPRLALMLATALAAVCGFRAPAGPVPPTPGSLPDPAAILLPPVVSERPDPDGRSRSDTALPRPVSHSEPEPDRRPVRSEPAARLRLNASDYTRVRGMDYEQSRTTSTSHAGSDSAGRGVDDPYEYLTRGSDERIRRSKIDTDDRKLTDRLGERIDQLMSRGQELIADERRRFESDRAFDSFISPVTNPFFFEDPRSLTELRPIAVFQKIPDGQPTFRGGNAMFFGGQARLALGDRWSLVVNKVGASMFSPGSDSALDNSIGLSELWLGPKVVLIRDLEFQTLVSAGTTFQIPLGSSSVYQDTGDLSVVPYVSAAQKLMSTAWGTLNGMATVGYSFGTNSARSDYFYASAHIDFDLNNKHRFYPLAELNWFAYTKDGTSRDFGVEARDLANFGAAAKGANLVTWALGGRYRANNRWEFGGAFEGPLVGPRDMFDYRFTVDFIWRY